MYKDHAIIPLPRGKGTNVPNEIVIHSMAEYVYYLDRHWHASELLRKLGYSAHKLVTPGGTIITCREDIQGAYHAKGHNTNSLGIEFLVPGTFDYAGFIKEIKTPYLIGSQLTKGVSMVRQWMYAWDIPIDKVRRHSDIDPNRKKDPGNGFPWDTFKDMLR